jgi:hypothetical protein
MKLKILKLSCTVFPLGIFILAIILENKILLYLNVLITLVLVGLLLYNLYKEDENNPIIKRSYPLVFILLLAVGFFIYSYFIR